MRPTRCIHMLSRHALFSGASLPALQAIVDLGSWNFHRSGQSIVTAGVKGTGAQLLIDGTAEQLDAEGNGTGVNHGPGALLAPMCMFAPAHIDHTVMARTTVETLEISRAAMRSLLQRDIGLARLLASQIENHLAKVAVALRKLDARLERGAQSIDAAASMKFRAVPDRPDVKQGLPDIRNLTTSTRRESRAGPDAVSLTGADGNTALQASVIAAA